MKHTVFTLQLIGLLLILIVVASCYPPRYLAYPDDDVYLMADYNDAIRLWQAHDEIHRDLISIADLNAVYRSWEVRQAYIHGYRNQTSPDTAYLDIIIQRELVGLRNGHEFILGLYCHERDWAVLTGTDPIWRIRLFSDTGGPVTPIRIERFTVSPEEEWYYADFISHGRQTYKVFFPMYDSRNRPLICKETKCFRLSCDSILGNMILKWRLGPIPPQLQ
ncbi:hypothetical protein JW979_10335 [bacterium]|nr:hypothetical protein [candidate division CSSED10-310 bacterium]